jgi:hypothetical protein
MTPAMAVQKELMEGVQDETSFTGPYTEEQKVLKNHKKALIMLLGTAAQQAMSGSLDLKTEQEIVMNMADMITEIYKEESVLARCIKIDTHYPALDKKLYEALLKTVFHDGNNKIYTLSLDLLGSFIPASMQGAYLSGIRKYTKYTLQNVKENRRAIANAVIERQGYCF